MIVHPGTLNPTKRKKSKRVGRGGGSGIGKTCGRGMNGQKCRAGGSIAPWFEGGQMPFYRHLPIRGFNNARFRTAFQVVNLERLERLPADTKEVTPELLAEKGLIRSPEKPVKILGIGEIKRALKISAHRFSKSADEKIRAAGGETVTL
jgi:large subunit ribosomal protein L15